MTTRFAGQTVIVTGAGSGMGRATALAFAHEGAAVVVADQNVKGGEETVRAATTAGGKALFQEVDVRREEDVARLVAAACSAFGPPDVMVNNAAVLGAWKPIAEQDSDTLDLVFDVNVKGAVYGMKHALAAMRPRKSGVIVNVSSVQGFRVVYPGAAFYAASKAALVSLTKSAALEYGAEGIRVVGIAPAPIDTPMLRNAAGNAWPPPIINDVPLGRIGLPEDIANTILWLCSPEANYISGTTIPVDGAFLAP